MHAKGSFFRRLLPALLLLLALPEAVQAQFTFTTNNGTITITKYTGPGGDVTIPDTINGLPVTSLGDRAFISCATLTNVTIPDSVTSIGSHSFRSCTSLVSVTIGTNVVSIGDSAFFGCAALKTVTLPDGVTTIGPIAFGACASFTNVIIPKSVTSIGLGPFLYCTSLTTITVDPLNPFYSSLDGVLFNRDRTTLIAYPPGKGTSYAIPASVINIGRSAFYDCTSLTGVSFPHTVTNIEVTAFSGCCSLTNMTLPSSLNTIGAAAFSYCSSLTGIVIPAGVTSIGDGAFACCTSLMAITADANNSSYACVDGVLFNHSGTMLLQFPAGKAGSYAIPAGVTSIGAAAFASCYNLTGVTIPNGVTRIPDWAFDSCDSLTGVVIPDTVTSIGYMAFLYCRNMTNVTVGNNVTDIADLAFQGCYLLTGVYFTGNAPTLGWAFDEVSSATIYYLPGTSGWGPTFGGRPTALWMLPNPLILTAAPSFGVHTNGFGFIISWATNIPVVVEACTSLANSAWSPVATNTLTDGTSYFSDPQWTNYPARLYRLRSP